jgi:DNA-binding PadR family transcriptional regulator
MDKKKQVHRRNTRNLMWLAVLALLHERPMHPYEIAVLMREREISFSIKLNVGILYATINTLFSEGYIAIKGTERDGNLPERTVYQLTPIGDELCISLLRDLLENPEKQYPRFAAGLAFMAHLSPEEVTSLLSARVEKMRRLVGLERAKMEEARSEGINDLFLIENAYSIAMIDAELEWLMSLQANIKEGKLSVQTANGLDWKALAEGASMH